MYDLEQRKPWAGCVNVLLVMAALAFGLYAFFSWGGPSFLAPTRAAPSSRSVEYRIITKECIDFSVTYAMPDGTAQKDVRACPGQSYVDNFHAHPGDHAYLSIQHIGWSESKAGFACLIEVDGAPFAQVASAGFANIATCSKLVP